MKIKAALIDMDGTLYDSMPYHTLAWHRLMRELGIEMPRDEFYLYEGMTGEEIINLIAGKHLNHTFTRKEAEELYKKKAQYFHEYGEPRVMPGADKLVEAFVRGGVRCVLVTGSGQASLIDSLGRDFPGVFDPDRMVTSRNVNHCKPHPEPFLKGAALAGVKPEECVAIDNAPLGVKSAVDAGTFAVAVKTGPIPTEKFEEIKPAVIFKDMATCAEFLPLILALPQ